MNKNPDEKFFFQIPKTPLGLITCVLSPKGLSALKFFSEPINQSGAIEVKEQLNLIEEKIQAYFSGEKTNLNFSVDLSQVSDFQKKVLTACREIPYGEVETYGDLAKRIGKPGAAQAVGGAMARNPIPLVIPCHRVVAADGGLHGYSAQGGLETKSFLLTHEGISIINQQVIKDK